MKETNVMELAEKTVIERIYDANLKHIMKQAGDDFLKYNMNLKWQMASWAQKGWAE